MRKKFIISSLPRTGSEALVHSLANAGLNICPSEPFNIDSTTISGVDRYDHLAFTRKIFESYDGFKIIIHHTMQLLDMCEKNDAKLILIKRNNYLSSIASYIGLLRGKIGIDDDSSKHETWTSAGKGMVYEPIPFINHTLDRFLYHNYLIDHVYNQHECYLTTIHYEDPSRGISDLENYFECDIDLNLKQNTPLSEYFVNHEEFKDDIEKRLKKMQGRGLHLI